MAPNSCVFFNYDQALETTGVASFSTFLAWNYLGNSGKGRLTRAIGKTILMYALIIGSIVFVANYVLWNLPGYDWVKNPMGLPWWSEQVTYQTCLIKQADFNTLHPNCVFLNYEEVFGICILLTIVGYVLMDIVGRDEIEIFPSEEREPMRQPGLAVGLPPSRDVVMPSGV